MTKAEISNKLTELEDEVNDLVHNVKQIKSTIEEVLEDEFFNDDEVDENV